MHCKWNRILPGVLLPLVFVFSSALAAEEAIQLPAIEKAVLEALAKIEQAAEGLQANRFSEMVVPEGSVIQNGKLFASREEAQQSIELAYRGVQKQEINFRQPNVTALSATVALVTAESDSSATLVDGRTITVSLAWTVLFVLRDGQWKVLHAHTSVPPRR